jgi:cytidylate kinase
MAFYGVRQSDPKLYHLVIDSTALSFDACTEIVVAAAKDRFGSS